MNILVVSAWCPFPADNGSRLRAFHLLTQLARQGHRLTLIALAQEDSDLEAAQNGLEPLCAGGVTLFPSHFFRPGTLRSRLGFFSSKPRMLLDTWQPEAAREIARQCHDGLQDVVLALELGVAHYIPADTPKPCFLDQVEVSSFARSLSDAPSLRRRLRIGLMLAKLRAHVASLAPVFAHWTAVSEDERRAILRLLEKFAAPSIEILANGVDLDYNTYEPERGYDPNALVYNGALSFYANREAVEYFAADIMPLIRQHRPETVLAVTGKSDALGPDDPLRRAPGVRLTGFLDDIRPTVRGAAACVVPLRSGGGTRLKILEAMALGTPVVATPRGAEGIDCAPGEDILIADTATEFAQATLALLTDPALRRRIGAGGRRLVESRYGWDRIGERLGALLEAAHDAPRETVCP